jgi:hypothetical protein
MRPSPLSRQASFTYTSSHRAKELDIDIFNHPAYGVTRAPNVSYLNVSLLNFKRNKREREMFGSVSSLDSIASGESGMTSSTAATSIHEADDQEKEDPVSPPKIKRPTLGFLARLKNSNSLQDLQAQVPIDDDESFCCPGPTESFIEWEPEKENAFLGNIRDSWYEAAIAAQEGKGVKMGI